MPRDVIAGVRISLTLFGYYVTRLCAAIRNTQYPFLQTTTTTTTTTTVAARSGCASFKLSREEGGRGWGWRGHEFRPGRESSKRTIRDGNAPFVLDLIETRTRKFVKRQSVARSRRGEAQSARFHEKARARANGVANVKIEGHEINVDIAR